MGRKPKPESLARMQNQSPMASYLEKLCKERGLSLRAASLAAGLGEATLGNLVRGYRRDPDPVTLRKIAAYFNLSEDALLELAGHRSTPVDLNQTQIADPELRAYLSAERVNQLSPPDILLLKAVLRHLMHDGQF
jgi:transcriptional regulator with XRE-family HTH domain